MGKIFTSRNVSGKSYLALKGNSKFARFSNLTGTELLGKIRNARRRIQDAKLRLATKFLSWVELSDPQPAFAHAGLEIKEIPKQDNTPNNYYLKGKINGTDETNGAKAKEITPEQELADFGRFIAVLEQEKTNLSKELFNIFLGGMIIGAGSLMILVSLTGEKKWNDVIIFGSIAGIGSSISIVRSAFRKLTTDIQNRTNTILKNLVSRYQTKEIPPTFKAIDTKAVAKLETMIHETNGNESEKA